MRVGEILYSGKGIATSLRVYEGSLGLGFIAGLLRGAYLGLEGPVGALGLGFRI